MCILGHQVKLHTVLVLVNGELAALTALLVCLLDSKLILVVMRKLVRLFAIRSQQSRLLFITTYYNFEINIDTES